MLVRARDSRNLLSRAGDGTPSLCYTRGRGRRGLRPSSNVGANARAKRMSKPMQYEISSSKSWYVHSEPRRLT